MVETTADEKVIAMAAMSVCLSVVTKAVQLVELTAESLVGSRVSLSDSSVASSAVERAEMWGVMWVGS